MERPLGSCLTPFVLCVLGVENSSGGGSVSLSHRHSSCISNALTGHLLHVSVVYGSRRTINTMLIRSFKRKGENLNRNYQLEPVIMTNTPFYIIYISDEEWKDLMKFSDSSWMNVNQPNVFLVQCKNVLPRVLRSLHQHETNSAYLFSYLNVLLVFLSLRWIIYRTEIVIRT